MFLQNLMSIMSHPPPDCHFEIHPSPLLSILSPGSAYLCLFSIPDAYMLTPMPRGFPFISMYAGFTPRPATYQNLGCTSVTDAVLQVTSTPSSLDSLAFSNVNAIPPAELCIVRNNNKEDVNPVLECSQSSWLNLWIHSPRIWRAGCIFKSVESQQEIQQAAVGEWSQPPLPPLSSQSLPSYQPAEVPSSPLIPRFFPESPSQSFLVVLVQQLCHHSAFSALGTHAIFT